MPGPTFTRPAPHDTGEATRRHAFEQLLDRRVQALTQHTNPPATSDDLALLRSIVDAFTTAVDRTNSSRGVLRQQPLEYVDAVLVEGSGGQLVVDAVEYDAAPVYWQARAGEVDSILHGADLDGYLRTGDRAYAERIGLR